MKTNPWPRPAAGWLACSMLVLALGQPGARAQGAALAASDVAAPTLQQAFEAAWRRAPEATEAQGRQDKAVAEQRAAHSWIAAPAALSLSQREGRAGAPIGSRETELGWTLPLWRWGQRTAGTQASEAELEWAQALEQLARLRLYGELREAAAAVQGAEVELKQAERHAQSLRLLALDVERRVQAGDLAPADALAARAEWLGAQAQVHTFQQALKSRRSAWRMLTGLDRIPVDEGLASPRQDLPETHPELRVAAAAVENASRQADLLARRGSGSPALNIGVRTDRPGLGANGQNSVVVGLRFPVGGSVHRAPAVASALAQLELARVQAQRNRERLTAQLALALEQVQASEAQLQAERERAALLSQRAAWIDKSFRAGESPLPDLLRALAAAADAASAQVRQSAALNLARARLEQSLGTLP